MHTVHIEEVIGVLSLLLLYLKLAPLAGNLKVIVPALQLAMVVAQMYRVSKQFRKKQHLPVLSPKVFVTDVAQHFLETHPEGKMIAKESEVDEQLVKLMNDTQVPGNG